MSELEKRYLLMLLNTKTQTYRFVYFDALIPNSFIVVKNTILNDSLFNILILISLAFL